MQCTGSVFILSIVKSRKNILKKLIPLCDREIKFWEWHGSHSIGFCLYFRNIYILNSGSGCKHSFFHLWVWWLWNCWNTSFTKLLGGKVNTSLISSTVSNKVIIYVDDTSTLPLSERHCCTVVCFCWRLCHWWMPTDTHQLFMR